MERESAGAPEGPTARSSGEVLPTPPADPQPESEGEGNQSQGPKVEDEAGEDSEHPQPESEGGGNQSQGLEVEDEAGEDSEDPLPVGDRTESHVMTGSETGGGDDALTRGPLQASPSQLQQWQQEDPSLGKAREAAWDSQPEGASSRVYFFTEMDYCIDIGNLRGPSQGMCEAWNSWSCLDLAVGWSCALAMIYPWPAT